MSKTRTPESIEKAALALPLTQRVALCQALMDSINYEVEEAKKAADEAAKAASVLAKR